MAEHENTTEAAEPDVGKMVDQIVAGLVAIDEATPKPVFTPVPDEELSYAAGFVGHLDGIGVFSATTMAKTINEGQGDAFDTTSTVYALEVGGVWVVDEWGDHEEWPDHEPDEAALVVQDMEDRGWETVAYDTIHGRMSEARQRLLVDGDGHRRPLVVGGPYLSDADAEADAGPWWSRYLPEDQQKAGQARVRTRIAETLEAAGVEVSEAEQRIIRILANDDTHGKILQGVVLDWIRRAYRAGQHAALGDGGQGAGR